MIIKINAYFLIFNFTHVILYLPENRHTLISTSSNKGIIWGEGYYYNINIISGGKTKNNIKILEG